MERQALAEARQAEDESNEKVSELRAKLEGERKRGEDAADHVTLLQTQLEESQASKHLRTLVLVP